MDEKKLQELFEALKGSKSFSNISEMKAVIRDEGVGVLYDELPKDNKYGSQQALEEAFEPAEKKKEPSVSASTTSDGLDEEAIDTAPSDSYEELYGTDISLEGMDEPSDEEVEMQAHSDKQERIREGTQLSDEEIRDNAAEAERNKRLTEAAEDYDPDTFFEPTPDQFAQPTQEEVFSAPVAEIEEDIEGTLYKEDFEERELATEKAQYQEDIDRIKDIPDWSFRESEEFKAAIEDINADLFQAYNDAQTIPSRRNEKLNLIDDLEEEYGKYGFVFTKDALNIFVRTQDGKKTIKLPSGNDIEDHEKLKWFISANASPVESIKNEDYITKAFKVQKSRSVRPADTDGASMVAILDSFTEESIAFPTMFPKDPDNVTKDPNDWISFGPDQLDAAREMAEERGEIYEFDNAEEAEDFADGDWKYVSPVDIEGDAFFKERDLNYMILMKADQRYQEAYDEINYIEKMFSMTPDGKPSEKEIKKHPEFFLKDGRMRTDVKERLLRLKEEVIELREVVESDPKGREAIRAFNLYLQKESNKQAQIAAKQNEQAKMAKRYADDEFSEALNKYGIKKPLDKITPEELTSILQKNPSLLPEFEQFVADRLISENSSDMAATSYYLASTYFDRKTRKHIQTDFVDNWEAVKTQWKDGYANGNAAALILGISLGIEDIDSVTAEKISEHLLSMNKVQGRAFSRYTNSRSAADSWDAFKSDPFEITFGLVANSFAQIIPIGATLLANPSTGIAIVGTGAAGGFALGGPLGAVTGTMTSIQAASAFALEFTNSILEAARDEGYEIEDPEQMLKALNDSVVWEKGEAIGTKRGIAIGAFTALSAGLAGKIITTSRVASRIKKAAAVLAERLVVDPLMEGAGEATAQIVSGQGLDPFEVVLEMQGGIGSSAPTAAVSVLANSGKKVNVLTAIEMTRRDLVARENAKFEEISKFATTLHGMGQIDDSVNDAIQENLVLREEAEGLLGLSKNKKNKNVLSRAMDLLKAQKTLSKDDNSKKIYKEELAAIDSELSHLVKEGKLPAQELVNLDNITDVETGEMMSMQPQVTSYKINGKRYTKNDFKNKFDKMSDKKRLQSSFEVKNDDEFSNELAEKFKYMEHQEEAPEVSTAETVSDRGIAEEFEDIPDDETQTFSAESIERIPEQYRDRAEKSTSKEVKSRKTIFGIPIGRKETVIKEEFTYSVTGKEIKETIAKERTTEEAAPVQADTEVAEKQEKAAEVATTETTSDRGIAEDFKDIPDDETRTFPAESLEDIPEQYRDRAKKSTSKEVKSRRTVFGIPIGRKKTVIKEEFTYTLTGKEIKEQQAAQEERTTEEAAPVGAETEVAEVAPMAEVFYESEESIPKELKEAKSTTIKEVKKGRYRVQYNEDEVFIEAPAVTEEFESRDAVPQAIKDASSTVITEIDDGKVSVTYKEAEVLGVTLEGKKKEAPRFRMKEDEDIVPLEEFTYRKPSYIPFRPTTKDAKLNTVEGAGERSYEISTPEYKETEGKKGATVIGYISDVDFPGQPKSKTRGEVFIIQVNDKGKGMGTSLTLDALALMKRNGTETVKFTVPSKEGKPFIDTLEKKGYIEKIQVDERTGTAEYKITDKVLGDTKTKIDDAKTPPRKRLRLADEKKADTKEKEAAITKDMKAMDQGEIDFVVPRGKSERQDVNPVRESRSETKLTDEEIEKMGFDSVDDMSRPIEYYEGIPMGILMSDHLASGTHKDASGKEMQVRGGILFNTLGSIINRALAWAGVNKDGATKQYQEALAIYKANKPLFERLWAEGKIPYGHIPFVVAKMGETAINSNEAVFRWLGPKVKELEAKYKKRAKPAFKAFVDSIKKLEGLTPAQRETLQETKAKLEQDPGNQKLQETLDNLEEKQAKQILLDFIKKNKITTMSQLLDAVVKDAAIRAKDPSKASLSLPVRSFLFKNVFLENSKNPNNARPSKPWTKELLADSKNKKEEFSYFVTDSDNGVYNQITEPSMKEGRQGDIVAVMGIKVLKDLNENQQKELSNLKEQLKKDPKNKQIQAEIDKLEVIAGGIKETDHLNYGWGPEGKLISFVSNPRHGTDVFAEWEVKASRVFKKGKKGFPSREGLRTQIGGAFFIDGAFRGMKVSAKDRGIAAMLIAKMRHAFPTVGITASKAEFDAMMERDDVRTRVVDGMIIYGITLDGNIYLNPEAIDIATPIHEYGHIWIDYLRSKALQAPKGKEAKLLAKGLALAKADKKNYDPLVEKYGDRDLAAEELLVELIATKGEIIANAAQKAKFKEWFNAFFKYIKEKFTKSKDITKSEIKALTLEKFANIGLADLFGGQLLDGKFDPAEVVASLKARLSIKESDGTKLTMDQIIADGRQDGFLDQSIKEYLKTQGYKVAEINKAMAINIDMNTPMPRAFANISGGSRMGIKMFNEIKKGLDNWIKSRWGKGKSFTDYRVKAMDLLLENKAFKAQSRIDQDRLIVAMDVVIGRKPAKDASAPINSIKRTVKLLKDNDWKGNIEAIRKSLKRAVKDLGGSKIHKKNTDKILALINGLDKNEANVKTKLNEINKLLNERIKDDKVISNKINADLAILRTKIDSYKKGGAARSKTINEVVGLAKALYKSESQKPDGLKNKLIIDKILASVAGINEGNAKVKFDQLIEALNELWGKQLEEGKKRDRLLSNIETLKSKIKERKNQAKNLAEIKKKLSTQIKEATMALRDLGVKEYRYSVVQALVSKVEKATINNIAKKTEEVQNALANVKETARKNKIKTIDKLLKKNAKTKQTISGRTRLGKPVGANGQEFYQAFLDFRDYVAKLTKESLVNVNLLQDAIQERERLQSTYPKKEDYQTALKELKNSDQANDKAIAVMIEKMDEILAKEKTNPFMFVIPELALGIDHMTLEQLNDLEIDLKGSKLIFAMQLANKKAAEKAITDALTKQANEQIEKDFPFMFREEVIDVDGRKERIKVLKSDNEIGLQNKRFRDKSIKEMLDGIKESWKTGTGLVNFMGHLGTICNYLDNIPGGKDFFTENVYKRLNRAMARHLLGNEKQKLVLNQIAQAVGVTSKISPDGLSYKKLKAIIFKTKPLEIAIKEGRKELTINEREALKILKQEKRKLLSTRSLKTGWIPLKNKKRIKGINAQIKAIIGMDPSPLSGDEQMRIYALSKNELQREKLKKQGIDKNAINEIKDNLGPQLVEFVDKVVEYLSEEYYTSINNVYRDVNNVNLKKIDNYFPTKTISISADLQSILISDSDNIRGAFNAQFESLLKERTDTKSDVFIRSKNKNFNFTEELENHMDGAERYKAYAKDVKQMNAFMRTPVISKLLARSGLGGLTYKLINNSVNPVTQKDGAFQRFIRYLYAAYVGKQIGFKPMQFLKQATSFILSFTKYSNNLTEKLPLPLKIATNLVLFGIDQGISLFRAVVGTAFGFGPIREAYKESPLFRHRVKQFFSRSGYAKLESTINEKEATSIAAKIWGGVQFAQSVFVMAGDLAGVLGYWGVYKRDLKNGMDPVKALEKFEDYNTTQQTKRPGETNIWQLEAKKQVLLGLVTTFNSVPILLSNEMMQASNNIAKIIEAGKGLKKVPATYRAAFSQDMVRLIFAAGLGHAAYVYISNLSKIIEGDEEDREEVKTKVTQSMLGFNNYASAPLFGPGVDFALSIYNEDYYRPVEGVNPLSLFLTEFGRGLNKSKKGLDLNLFGAKEEVQKGLIELAVNYGAGINTDFFMGIADYVYDSNQEFRFYKVAGISKGVRPNVHTKMIDIDLGLDVLKSDEKTWWEILVGEE